MKILEILKTITFHIVYSDVVDNLLMMCLYLAVLTTAGYLMRRTLWRYVSSRTLNIVFRAITAYFGLCMLGGNQGFRFLLVRTWLYRYRLWALLRINTPDRIVSQIAEFPSVGPKIDWGLIMLAVWVLGVFISEKIRNILDPARKYSLERCPKEFRKTFSWVLEQDEGVAGIIRPFVGPIEPAYEKGIEAPYADPEHCRIILDRTDYTDEELKKALDRPLIPFRLRQHKLWEIWKLIRDLCWFLPTSFLGERWLEQHMREELEQAKEQAKEKVAGSRTENLRRIGAAVMLIAVVLAFPNLVAVGAYSIDDPAGIVARLGSRISVASRDLDCTLREDGDSCYVYWNGLRVELICERGTNYVGYVRSYIDSCDPEDRERYEDYFVEWFGAIEGILGRPEEHGSCDTLETVDQLRELLCGRDHVRFCWPVTVSDEAVEGLCGTKDIDGAYLMISYRRIEYPDRPDWGDSYYIETYLDLDVPVHIDYDALFGDAAA